MAAPLYLLIKPVSGECGLHCRYCFYRDIARSREVPSYGQMTEDTARTLIAKAMAYGRSAYDFAFQGGEPTLRGLDFYRRFLELVEQANTRRVPVSYAIQTNGMHMDAQWAAFLAQNRFLTGLSVDGTRDIHDFFRADGRGRGSFSAVLRAARLLEEAGADYNILTVVTEQLARHIRQVYAFYKKQGWRYQQYIPCLDPLEAPRGSLPYSLTPARYGAFLEELFDLWCADLLAGDPVSIRYFDNLADLCRGYPPESCGLSGVCACQHVVEADGSVYPCDFYVLDAYRLGNILTEDFQELDQSPRLRTFVEDSLRRPEECESCSWLPFCGGGCRRERDPVLGRAESPSVYCSAYCRFLPYALPRLRRLTQRL